MIYKGAPSSHLASIARTLMDRLADGYRCLYLNSPSMVAGLRWHLAAAGVDLEAEGARGALVFSSDQTHLVGGKFDTERMIELLDRARRDAEAGHAGLWAAGDMSWEFGHERNLGKLLEYERRLEKYMRLHPRMCRVCLYHCDILPDHAIQTALRTHSSLYVNATLSRINPSYLESDPVAGPA